MEKGKLGSKPRSSLSVAGLVLGILSVALFFIPFVRPVLAILAIIFGGIAVARRQKFGLAGLILGILSWVIWGIILTVGLNVGLNELSELDEGEIEEFFEEFEAELEGLELEE